jgi:hypothetical protein
MTYTRLTLGEPHLEGVPRGFPPPDESIPCDDSLKTGTLTIPTMAEQFAVIGAGPNGNQLPGYGNPIATNIDVSFWWQDTDSSDQQQYNPAQATLTSAEHDQTLYQQHFTNSSLRIPWGWASDAPTAVVYTASATPGVGGKGTGLLLPICAWDCDDFTYRHTARVTAGSLVSGSISFTNSGGSTYINYVYVFFWDNLHAKLTGSQEFGSWTRPIGVGSVGFSVVAPASAEWVDVCAAASNSHTDHPAFTTHKVTDYTITIT